MTTTTVHRGHVEELVVHFDDLDAMGLLHNARYAVLLERALSLYWHRHGFDYAGGRPSHPDVHNAVVEFAITYRVPVRGTGPVGMHFWLEQVGESSATYRFRLLSPDGSVIHAEGRRVIIKLDPATLRPSPWLPESRAVFELLDQPLAAMSGAVV